MSADMILLQSYFIFFKYAWQPENSPGRKRTTFKEDLMEFFHFKRSRRRKNTQQNPTNNITQNSVLSIVAMYQMNEKYR
jgi:hypothetical protein